MSCNSSTSSRQRIIRIIPLHTLVQNVLATRDRSKVFSTHLEPDDYERYVANSIIGNYESRGRHCCQLLSCDCYHRRKCSPMNCNCRRRVVIMHVASSDNCACTEIIRALNKQKQKICKSKFSRRQNINQGPATEMVWAVKQVEVMFDRENRACDAIWGKNADAQHG